MSPLERHSRASRPRSRRLLREPLRPVPAARRRCCSASGTFAQGGRSAPAPSKQIRLTVDELTQLALVFQSQWRREPTPEELARLVENRVQEEVLYREALAMGLDKDDTIVKRRMAQKMQFLAEDVGAAREPDRGRARGVVREEHATVSRSPARVSFRHLYFSPDRRGSRARDDAAARADEACRPAQDSKVAASLADPFMFQDYYRDRAPEQLGQGVRAAVRARRREARAGLVAGTGRVRLRLALVFVDTMMPGRVPAFEEVEADVKTAWLGEQKAHAWQKAYEDMRAKYTVLLPAPPDAAAQRDRLAVRRAKPAS